MITIYEVVYTIVCGDDGLISHTIKSIKEIMPKQEDDEEDEDEENGN